MTDREKQLEDLCRELVYRYRLDHECFAYPCKECEFISRAEKLLGGK